MPWTAKDAKRFKKGLTSAQAAKWAKIANGALRSCQAKGGKNCDASAIRIANSKFDWEEGGWDWADILAHDDYFGIERDEEGGIYDLAKKKTPAGGSNAGKYKTKGPFCGPAGGAPKGTYPVNTRARAIAAIAYARHAPNPSGIKSCVCRHWPSLPACKSKSKQSEGAMSAEHKLPKGALRFIDQGCHAHVEMAEEEGGKATPKLNMIAYSGGIIKGHWYWDNLAIDLEGIQFKQSKFPVLENHNTDRKVAIIGKPIIEDGKLKAPPNAKFLSTEASKEFQQLSQEGFPYQSSIYAKPSNIERVAEGAKAEVNGFTMKGPGTIWRKCEFKEMSVCVFGWDSQTQATAFSKDEFETLSFEEHEVLADCCGGEDGTADAEAKPKLKRRKEVKKIMEKSELQETYPDLIQEIVDEAVQAAVAEVETKFSGEKSELSEQVKTLRESNEKLSEKVLDLEKKDTIRAEAELKAKATAIWNQKLGESNIPEHVWDKVRPHVSHTKFVSEGVLDVEKFVEAVDAEIKDWEGKGVTSTVLGEGFTQKEPEGENKQAQEAESVQKDVERLAKLAGVETSKA